MGGGNWKEYYYGNFTRDFGDSEGIKKFKFDVCVHLENAGFEWDGAYSVNGNHKVYFPGEEFVMVLHREIVSEDGSPVTQTVIIAPLRKTSEMENISDEELAKIAPQRFSKADDDNTLRIYELDAISKNTLPRGANTIYLADDWSEIQYSDIDSSFLDVIEELNKNYHIYKRHAAPWMMIDLLIILVVIPSIVIIAIGGIARYIAIVVLIASAWYGDEHGIFSRKRLLNQQKR